MLKKQNLTHSMCSININPLPEHIYLSPPYRLSCDKMTPKSYQSDKKYPNLRNPLYKNKQ